MSILDERLIVEKIKSSYEQKPKKITKLEELKALDKKVKRPAIVFAYVFGILSTLILGTGLTLAMEIIGNIMAVGIVIGIVGIIMISSTYHLFQKLLAKRKAKYADIILEKSNKILNIEGVE